MRLNIRFLFLTGLAASFAAGQFRENTTPELNCDSSHRGRDNNHRTCEMREQKLPVSQKLDINASPNGGVSVKGWNRSEIWVRAKLEAGSKTSEADAKALAAQVRLAASAGKIEAVGPATRGDGGYWSVSYEVFVPHKIDLVAKTVNGGVTYQDVEGRLEYSTVNGGVNLARLAGELKGRTVNGGLNIDLDGARWNGAGVDIATTNGGVNVTLPAQYSAQLDVSTVNGGFQSEIPVTMQGDLKRTKQFNAALGQGGAPLKIRTTNGGVRLKRRGAA